MFKPILRHFCLFPLFSISFLNIFLRKKSLITLIKYRPVIQPSAYLHFFWPSFLFSFYSCPPPVSKSKYLLPLILFLYLSNYSLPFLCHYLFFSISLLIVLLMFIYIRFVCQRIYALVFCCVVLHFSKISIKKIVKDFVNSLNF